MTNDLNRIYLKPLIIALLTLVVVNIGLYEAVIETSSPLAAEVSAVYSEENFAEASPGNSLQSPDVIQQLGEWTNTNGVVIQQAQFNQDMLYGTGLIAEQFTISLDIALPADNPNAGGGILFHMAQRDDFIQSQMVRLADGGKTLLWGYYDESGIFTGEGSLPLISSNITSLKITVRATTYAVQINDVMIMDNLPLKYASGYVAYLSFSGPVSFSNLNILLTS